MSHMSHCVTCVTMFYLLFKQNKYCRCFPSRCWFVQSDVLKEKTALDAKMSGRRYYYSKTFWAYSNAHTFSSPGSWKMILLQSILIIHSCHFILCHFSSFLWVNLWKKHNSFTTSHISKEILKLKYSVNYKNLSFTTFDYSSQKKPRTLFENDAHVHFFTELSITFLLLSPPLFYLYQIFVDLLLLTSNGFEPM